MRTFYVLLTALMVLPWGALRAQQDAASKMTADVFRGIELRSIGPAVTPGRVADLEVDPNNPNIWYMAMASSGVLKTVNRGVTWESIFDDYGSYSTGAIAVDPRNSNIVWLGTGENQSLRSVSFGDGIYKSTDAGKTWTNVGLRQSEHIGKILIDPRDSNVVYVASQGPLWAPGGDRGLYKTTDGGKTWKPVLQIGENTGVTDIALDPRNPDRIYAASYQRRRHVGLLIGGGPEAGIFKSEDGGENWKELTNGIPDVDLGRIALAVSPHNPDIVYALVVAAGDESGFFRSADRGETWVRQSNYRVVDPQYYGEIYADPHHFDRIYAVDVQIHMTDNGGKTFDPVPWARSIHVDNHEIVFDPSNPDHMWVGNDGGLYETYDNGENWRRFNNVSTIQFYRVAVDNALPFYNIMGGAQDNGSSAGPSRTLKPEGISTSDWIRIGGGDGMQPNADPNEPEIVYSMSQNGSISRMDKRTSESRGIRPPVPEGEDVRWYWDAPFMISPHSGSRLYLAGSRLFRSDNRGNDWKQISGDLTRQIDRDTIPVMGRLWDDNAVTRNVFTSEYGVATALTESPLQEGLLYVGTDDGLIQVSEDGGENWRQVDTFPGVPEMTYVTDVWASRNNVDTVYASFANYKQGDFKPYALKSTDRGRSWTSIAGDLPDRHFVWTIVDDNENANLLFAGTEFALFVSVDGGQHWVPLKGNVPTIAFRDLVFQERENDLVAATFGRGFYILDDYTPLRALTPQTLLSEAALLPLRDPYLYHETTYDRPYEGDFTTPNPPFGAMLTYYLRDGVGSGERAGDQVIVLSVSDAQGKLVRDIKAPVEAGLHRVNWDLRFPPEEPEEGEQQQRRRRGPRQGALVEPGQFTVVLNRVLDGKKTPLGQPQSFEVVPLPGIAASGSSSSN